MVYYFIWLILIFVVFYSINQYFYKLVCVEHLFKLRVIALMLFCYSVDHQGKIFRVTLLEKFY